MFNPFVPHGHCYLWRSDLIFLHGISDGLISIAYFSIALLLIYFTRQREDVPFRKIFVLFSAFIISCGFTHTLEVWTLWVPAYWISGGIKMTTALISIYTAFTLIPVLPQALVLPSPSELALLNQTLSDEIQERKQAEIKINSLNEQLQEQITDLEQVAILKDEFISTVSHELRTPLASMKMALTMLNTTQDPERQRTYLNILESEWKRELKLVNQLLDLQALSAGNKIFCVEEINLAEWVPTLLETFTMRCQNYNQELSLQFSQSLLPLFTDPDLLEQVILELMNNACKYTPSHQRIQLVCESITTGCQITLTNTGVTIPEADQLQLFDKFFRNAKLDHFNQGGTGLGLAIVKKTVELLQGTIEMTSTNQVTRFILTLPQLT